MKLKTHSHHEGYEATIGSVRLRLTLTGSRWGSTESHPTDLNSAEESAVALVITLLMLSVITFLAVAFLAMTNRDRSAVTATLDVANSRAMSDAALARAQTEIIGQMMAQTDILGYDYLASHNYFSPTGFIPGNTDATNVNYGSFGALTPANAQNWAQNIGNLFYDPRPPVFVMTNGDLAHPANDFRFWVDLNRNGRFESNGYLQENYYDGSTITSNGLPVTNFFNGEPEWIGVLKYPEYVHSPTNPFVGRYAYMALPIGKTLDLNFIHNYSKFLVSGVAPTTSDGFSRDEGVGSWELNLAALLNDINTNMYPPSGGYEYNLAGQNLGYSFDDAVQFIRYRYTGYNDSTYPQDLINYFGTFDQASIGLNAIDEYAASPRLDYPFDFNQYYASAPNTPGYAWPGSYNTNSFYDVQDLFDPNKTGPNNANAGGTFSHRFASIMTNADSYDRYTMQRLLDCIGTGSAPEYGVYVYSNLSTTNFVTLLSAVPPPSLLRTKVNINYNNTAQIQAGPYGQTAVSQNGQRIVGPYGSFTPMPTNLVPWTPLGFFTNAADLLLRSQVFCFTNYLTNIFGQVVYATNTLGLPQPVQVAAPSNWIYATFGITNIPVYVATNPGVHYNEQIHRMLQLAANIYAAANPVYLGSGANRYQVPPIFRPQFLVVPSGNGTNLFVTITGYIQVTNDAYTQINQQFHELSDSTNTYNQRDGTFNFWGIPWIVGAVKGLPAFDQYSYQNQVFFARPLQFVRYRESPGPFAADRPPQYTNQFYEISLTNITGMDAWNPYNSNFSGSGNGLYVVVSNLITVSLMNTNGWRTNIYVTNVNNWNLGAPTNRSDPWQAGQFQTFVSNVFCSLPLGYFSDSQTNFVYINPTVPGGGFTTDTNQTTYPTHTWTTTVSNHLCYALFDGIPAAGNSNLLDFVNLGPFGSSLPITQYLINRPDQYNTLTYPMWTLANTTDAGLARIPTAVQAQINYSVNQIGNTLFNNSLLGITPGGYSASTPAFGLPSPVSGSITMSIGNYVPIANYTDSNIWMTCDPLVHYTLGDLSSPSTATPGGAILPITTTLLQANPSMTLSLNRNTTRYMLGAENPDPDMVFKDPNMTNANNWQFPTNLFPGVGWLGRVHRGTPWQTVYLKPDGVNPAGVNPSPSYANWTNSWVNSPFTYPTNDWSLIDLFTAVPNDNAARGLLSVNQTNDAAWAAVFSGVIFITNLNTTAGTGGGLPLNPTNDVYYLMDASNAPAFGINVVRTLQPNGIFHKIGDILQASALTVSPPEATEVPLSDEMVERIPQQTLGLLKVGLPQFVIYSWGQSLKPKNLYSSGSGNLLNICTNYEITGEYLTRTVCHIVGDPSAAAPRIVIDNYNIVPGN